MKCFKLVVSSVIAFAVLVILPFWCLAKEYNDEELLNSIKDFVVQKAQTDDNCTTISIKDWKGDIGRTKISWTDEDLVRIFCSLFEKTHTTLEIIDFNIVSGSKSGGGIEVSFVHIYHRKKLAWNSTR
jgi:hypothetical protein